MCSMRFFCIITIKSETKLKMNENKKMKYTIYHTTGVGGVFSVTELLQLFLLLHHLDEQYHAGNADANCYKQY